MNRDYWILIGVWVFSIVLLVFAIPREKIRFSLVAFLIKQLITCATGLVTVELGLLTYPVRELADINRTSLTFEYMAYPAMCAVFNAHYPKHRSILLQFAYYAAYCTPMTLLEVLLEKHTNVIHYVHWNWFYTWSSLFITFWLARVLTLLYFRAVRTRPS